MDRNEPIRWGILGPGKIAHKFSQDLQKVKSAVISAVASRSMIRAQEFAAAYQIPNVYDSYEKLSKSTDVDIIYIATPHTYHCEHTLMCLNHGKHVLCEKPMAINHGQMKEMIEAAQRNNCFLMEAIWTAFFPAIGKLKNLLSEGIIGDVRMIEADFGFTAPVDYAKRLYNPELAGGALLDIGIYPLFLAHFLKGAPGNVLAMATMTETRVDGSTAIAMSWADGTLASLNTTIFADTSTNAMISGSEGYIVLHRRWHEPRQISLYNKNELLNSWTYKDDCFGYIYEIEEVHHCLNEGKIESDIVTHQLSQDLVRTMDRVRQQIGLVYPFE